MIIKAFKRIIIPCLILFVASSSIFLEKSTYIIPLLMAGCGLYLSILLDKRYPSLRYVQFALLGIFHWYSQMNWCSVLYFSLVLLTIMRAESNFFRKELLVALLYVLEYTAIRLTYQPISKYNLFVSIYDAAIAVITAYLFHYVHNLELEKRNLHKKNRFLSLHDSLTGLLNYEGYMDTVQKLVDSKRNFVLVLLDFQNFKSITNENIDNGNQLLGQLAFLLKTIFLNSIAMSRFAGDMFAILLPQEENVEREIESMLDSKMLGFQVTYSITLFPQESVTRQELIALAEGKLFQEKRKNWLKREENMFRSEKMKVVGELAAGMAHEIRNPLTTLRGFVQLSQKYDYNIRPWFEVIMNEITRMNELTAEFLQFSKPHLSNMKVESVSRCLDRLLFLTESEALYLGHHIVLEATDAPICVNMDRDKIVQVLLNLVRNAFEAMKDPGYVYIRLNQEKDFAVIEIEDTGKGIDEQELSQIFHPFFTTKENGTGLGLSICQKIVQDHGGSLDVESILGRGSRFVVKLPMAIMKELCGVQ